MNTTKTGLKLSVFAAIAYFGALKTPLIPLMMLGYLAVTEQGEEVRKLVSQALTVLGLVWLIGGGYDVISQLVNFLNSFVGDGYLHMPFALNNFLTFALDAVVFACGVLALLGKYTGAGLGVVDRAVQQAQKHVKPSDTEKEDAKQ